jgi:uncharacterized Zn finger protein
MNAKELQSKGDKLLTPLIKLIYPKCEACGQETQVAHHFIEKSRSNLLRHDVRNLIALCNSCHTKIHNRFGNSVVGSIDVFDIIVKKRGKKWYKEIRSLEHKTIKADSIFWNKRLEELTKLLEEYKKL